jgi:hypothetical protein
MRYISVLVSSLLLIGCAQQQALIKKVETKVEQKKELKKRVVQKQTIQDLYEIPQDVSFYTKNLTDLNITQEKYEKNYFKVWNISKVDITLEDAMWAHKLFNEKNSYGENLQLRKKSFFENLLTNANYEKFSLLNQTAVTLHLLNLRAMPTEKPLFRNPSKAGEGFPFDYLQNSTIAPNKPVLISHYSKDKEWVFIESSFTFGWVKSCDIVPIKREYALLWQEAKQIFLSGDNEPIYSTKGEFLFRSRLGMLLPLIGEDKDSFTVLSVTKDAKNKAYYRESKLSKKVASKKPLQFNAANINKIIQLLSLNKYGWGGMYGERDCSATVRDFYAPFGLWLPRNSSKQSLAGNTIYLDGLSNQEKINLIKKKAEPFKTLLYKRGHIAIYVGLYKNKPIIFQNVWGVKTDTNGKKGRFIIGKPIFSSLEVGKNLSNFDKNSSMLQKLKTITKL